MRPKAHMQLLQFGVDSFQCRFSLSGTSPLEVVLPEVHRELGEYSLSIRPSGESHRHGEAVEVCVGRCLWTYTRLNCMPVNEFGVE